MDPRLRMIEGANPADEQQILSALDDPTIKVLLPAGTPDWRHQLLAVTLVDLLGRLFGRIDIQCDPQAPADPALPPGPALLAERLQQVREHGCGPTSPGDATITIAIGPTTEPADLHLDGAGWQSYLGTAASRLEGDEARKVPVGAMVAAARGGAQIFALLLKGLLPDWPIPGSDYFSALTYGTAPDPQGEPSLPPIGALDAVLVGGGSVGGAAIDLFAHTPGLGGDLAVVDPQALQDHNFVRAILATRAAASAHEAKVDVAAAALAHRDGLTVDPQRVLISEYVASRPRQAPLPLVLCAVDSPGSRRSIQDCLPLELVNAACSRDEVMISGHRTDDGPCVCCLHMRETMDGQSIRVRLIAQATGLNFGQVIMWMIQKVPLDAQALRFIEERTGRPQGALKAYAGNTLDELWDQQLRYGATVVLAAGGAQAAVAAPWVTALAGFMLAAEALKAAGDAEYRSFRLGPDREPPGLHYAEATYASPANALLTIPERWPGTECLCGSPRRLRLLRERHGLADPAK